MGVRAFPPSDLKRTDTFSVFAAMLTRGMSSPLFLALREPKGREGLLYDFEFSYIGYAGAGIACFEAMANEKKIPMIRNTFLNTMLRTAVDHVRFEEAKTMIAKGRKNEQWDVMSVFDEANYNVIECGVRPRTRRRELQDIENVTLEDVKSLVRDYLMPEHFSTVTIVGTES